MFWLAEPTTIVTDGGENCGRNGVLYWQHYIKCMGEHSSSSWYSLHPKFETVKDTGNILFILIRQCFYRLYSPWKLSLILKTWNGIIWGKKYKLAWMWFLWCFYWICLSNPELSFAPHCTKTYTEEPIWHPVSLSLQIFPLCMVFMN